MVKTLNFALDDESYKRLMKKKGDQKSWKEYLLDTLRQGTDDDEYEWKDRVRKRLFNEEVAPGDLDRILSIAFEELKR